MRRFPACPKCYGNINTKSDVIPENKRSAYKQPIYKCAKCGAHLEESGPDVFVHYSGIEGNGFRTLKENDRVTFEIEDGPKGPSAVNVNVQ